MASLERPDWAPEPIDVERPNAARIYDYMLGGASNFASDREFAERLLQVMPEARRAARMNRAFLRRAVRFCAEAGIRQFLDIGSGIPTAGNVHETAQHVDLACRVVYVDNEPVAVAHSELMLRGNPNAAAVLGDLTKPDTVLSAEPVTRLIDFDQPMALLIVSMLHFVPDQARPYEAVARYIDMLAPDSYLVLSHGVEINVERADQVDTLYRNAPTPGVRRRWQDVERFFAGVDLIEPGLVWTPLWRPDSPHGVDKDPETAVIIAGVGRKP